MTDAPDFDWVTARHACSLTAIFELLKTAAEQDVARRLALRDAPPLAFRAQDRVFIVYTGDDEDRRVVKFRLTARAIAVSANDAPLFEGAPTLSDDGHCRLKVGEAELELWQFRKRALEGLLFPTFQ